MSVIKTDKKLTHQSLTVIYKLKISKKDWYAKILRVNIILFTS